MSTPLKKNWGTALDATPAAAPQGVDRTAASAVRHLSLEGCARTSRRADLSLPILYHAARKCQYQYMAYSAYINQSIYQEPGAGFFVNCSNLPITRIMPRRTASTVVRTVDGYRNRRDRVSYQRTRKRARTASVCAPNFREGRPDQNARKSKEATRATHLEGRLR